MFDYQSLTDINNKKEIYLKIPSKSRKQGFIAYSILENEDENLKIIADTFQYRYLVLQKPSKTIIIIPFQAEIKTEEFENIEFDFVNQDFEQLSYGHSYRDRTQNRIPFKQENKDKPEIDALKYITNQTAYFNEDKIKKGLDIFMNTREFAKIKTDKLKQRKFLQPLANDIYKKTYTQKNLSTILDILRPEIPNIDKEYQTTFKEINKSADLRNRTDPFGKYLKLYKVDKQNVSNISQQMLSTLDADFKPNPKLELSIAADLISSVYPPALIRGSGRDKDNVVIFNPLEGVWIHNEDTYYALLTAIRPYSKQNDLTTMIATFAAQARNKNNFIDPYNQSRHLLFLNTALDVKTMTEKELDSDEVKDLNFTERCQIHINYDKKVTYAPEFPGKRRHDGGTWDPWTFLMAYADNDVKKYEFLLFGLSLGLFAGHNFGVHFNITGESRFGKTTLSEIFKALFPQQVFEIIFSKLNEQFGFTNFKPQTSIIWIRECNTETAPLNNEYGVPIYDSLADNQTSLQIKKQSDLQLTNPPQVYIDGTSYVKAKDMDTGPAGRTFVYKLPTEDDSNHSVQDLIDQAYANDIVGLLHDESVLQFLVNSMIEAYRNCLKLTNNNYNRLWSLRLNLGGKSKDVDLLPEFAKTWRREMTTTQGGDIKDWFEYDFEPYLLDSNQTDKFMHNALAYMFYTKDYHNKYSRQDPHSQFMLSENSFSKQFTMLLNESGWVIKNERENNGRKKRRSIKYLKRTCLDLDKYENDAYKIPEEFTDKNIDSDRPINSFPLGTKIPDWYRLTKEP